MITGTEIRNRLGECLDYSFHPGTRADALVILGHGLTGNKDRPQLVALADGLSAHGWPCLRISFAGNGKSEGNFEDCCITKEVQDLQALLAVVPNDVKVAYLGHSMGGAVGVLTAARDLRIRCLISLAGMTHTAAFAEREFSEVTPDVGWIWDDPNFPLSSTLVDDLKAIESIIPAAAAVTQPWLLIHGNADEIIPIEDLRAAFEAATCEKRQLEIEGAGHSFDPASYPQLVVAAEQWLKSSFH